MVRVAFFHGCSMLTQPRRWLFLIEGSITIAIACFAIFILPNFPRTTSWLSEEKQLAAWRLEEDIGEDDWVDSEHQSFLDGAKQAALDIKTWILVRWFSRIYILPPADVARWFSFSASSPPAL